VVQQHLELLEMAGISRDDADVLPAHASAPFDAAWTCALHGSDRHMELELPFVAARCARALVLFGLVTPERSVSPVWWAVNKRSFELAHTSLSFGRGRSS
jgi:hypothetical protein